MTSMPRFALLPAFLLLAATTAIPTAQAQTAGDQMPGMNHATPGAAASSPSSQAFKAANDRMMTEMNMPMSGDTDRDFVAGMIPHHQGAIDMAQAELKYGKDPQIKKLARSIISAQKKEIALMKRWQQQHGVSGR